jgi:NADH dehydrogenase
MPVPGRAAATSGVPRVVIVGGGFAGLSAARALRGAALEVTLVDRRNHHLFQPLLYQVASAVLNTSDIASPIRKILRRQKNVTVLLGEVERVELDRRRVVLVDGGLSYDFLILAAGATDSYFAHPEWKVEAPGLKSLDQAVEIRNRVLFAFEAAERETDPERRRAWLTFVVIGGGPTGVELAGALAEIAFHSLVRDFRSIDSRQAKVVLLEGGERILPAFSPESAASAVRQLERLGVEVRSGALVTAIDPLGVTLGGERIASRTKLWAAGVRAVDLTRSLGVALDRGGRVVVAPDLSLPGHPEAFAVGDLCAVQQDGKLVPGVAPAAMQAGRHAARSVLRLTRGEATRPFHYVDKGSLATIGRRAAVAEIGRFRLSGVLAWFAWLTIHLFFLIGYRNRVLVLFEWAWAYVTKQRGARLITTHPATVVEAGEAEPIGGVSSQTSRSETPIARSMIS